MRFGSAALATERVERRLAAILAADVAGYSRLMGADEEGTHERLKTHLRELVDPKITEHRGRRHCQLSRPWYARSVGGAAARVGSSFARLLCCPL
jgi:class 3 adenylate cyclase